MICQEISVDDTACGGQVTVEREDDWLWFRCAACGIERVRHANTADPEQKRQLRMEQACLPERFVGRRFEETDGNKSALYAIRGWLEDFRDGKPLPAPALYGQAGRGKTHLLTAVCVRLVRERDAAVLFRSARALLRELQDFDGDAERMWRRATTVDVLALDDLGAQQQTDWRHDQISDLIHEREEAELPILVATNFAPAAWGRVMDERTASRLRGMTLRLELRGEDRRQEQFSTTRPTESEA